MAAYIIVQVDVKDQERYARYKGMVAPTLEPFNGRFLVRGGRVQALEGGWDPSRLVVIEFDSAEQARAWWASDDYAPAKRLRQATADTQMILVEGV